MTYPDPNRVRTFRLTLRLDQYEHDLVQAMANIQGEQLSTLAREVLLKEAQQVMVAVHEDSLGARAA